MYIIIITGLPATGKTTLGRKISKEFQIPMFSKDDFKENLFDSLGFKDREWSKKIGKASYKLLYKMLEINLMVSNPIILESNFDPNFANSKINKLQEKYPFTAIQIRCFTHGEILYERFKKRANSTERHLGHVDQTNLNEWENLKKGRIEVLNIRGEIIDFNTTDFEKVNYTNLFRTINSMIK